MAATVRMSAVRPSEGTLNASRVPRSLQQKQILITGGTSGIGLEATKMLAEKGAKCTVLGFDVAKGQSADRKIERAAPDNPNVKFEQCDLTSLSAVQKFADHFKEHHDRLDVLVMDAGTFLTEYQRSADGFEQTIASNYIGHFYLTHLLLPLVRANAPSRIVWMASAYEQLGRVHWDDIGGEYARDSGLLMYCSAKVMSIMAAREMQRRLRGTGIDVFSVQPGLVNTPLFDKADWSKPATWINRPGARLLGQSAERGAISTVRAASDPELQGKGWGYYGPPYLGVPLPFFNDWRWSPINPLAHDAASQRRLYDETVRLLEQKTGKPLPNKLMQA